ncbi:Transposable element P transposase [Amphibalanus amphitrite]|uniref:Transposable element P transposase n=1 Tax=Amphibalanus amphitrite TaxID=1232801 RepID=A0A6A4VDI1_AMPAM|nr:Transposable element P transposase [Amphibalanus amphitrite]
MVAALAVLKAAVQGMDCLQRLCVVSFDEMSLDGRYCYDSAMDQILQGSKLQLLMVRGLCGPWKQPLFYELDTAMTLEKFADVVSLLESLGLTVVAVVSDMGSSNEVMWRTAGVSSSRPWIANPADQTRRIWVFADTPHLVKLMRVHTVSEDGGFLIPNGRGGKALLSRNTFKELMELDDAELRISHKLTSLHLTRGILRTTASLRGLYSDLLRTTPELKYIFTSHLNQDCVENCFSQLRSMGGANNAPNAVEIRSRLKVLLMAPSPMVAVRTDGRAVLQLESDTGFVSTGRVLKQPDNLSNQALEGLPIQFEDSTATLVAEEADQIGQAADEVGLEERGDAAAAATAPSQSTFPDPAAEVAPGFSCSQHSPLMRSRPAL